jgi:hypothetical protein
VRTNRAQWRLDINITPATWLSTIFFKKTEIISFAQAARVFAQPRRPVPLRKRPHRRVVYQIDRYVSLKRRDAAGDRHAGSLDQIAAPLPNLHRRPQWN